ncbi:MAG: response regulator [Clostridiales Family XIII bacterium]|jgi:putative two-component system response regulator|nr:response regulator [Clostridiales Family XIII bacterium]
MDTNINTEKKVIMLVDDNVTNLTAAREILKDKYKTYPIPSAKVLFDLLEKIIPDMILLDVEMPEMNGFQAIEILKADKRYMDIPVIFLTAQIAENSELEGLSKGAVDYVQKPFIAPLLLRRIENHLLMQEQKNQLKHYNENLEELVSEKTKEIYNLQNAILATVSDMVEFRDDITGGHVSRTQGYLLLLIQELLADGIYKDEIEQWNVDEIIQSAQLHDVGKISISDLILNKPGRLTDEEFKTMQEHVNKGVEIINTIEKKAHINDFLTSAKIIAATHHEKWDGSGYPNGLKGTAIPLEGRLMAIADVYDALVSVRPYKKAFTPAEAERIIIEGRGTHFDSVLVDAFTKVSNEFALLSANR